VIRSIIAIVVFVLAGLALSAWSLHRRRLRGGGGETGAESPRLGSPADVEGQAWADIAAPKDEQR
jgi:hypothetical protein